jgi:hypothetical protein
MAELHPEAAGIWRGEDGLRVRALLYSSTCSAAATLVPPGYWIEDREDGVAVVGPGGEWTGVHESRAIALCLAALRARLSAAGTAA